MEAGTAERRRSGSVAQKGETKFHGVFARTTVGIALIDRGGRITESNPALQRMLGYTAHELSGRRFYEFAQTPDADSLIASFSQIATYSLHEFQSEVRFNRHDNQMMWARLTVSQLRREEHDVACAAVIMEDVTERKRAEDALRLGEFKYRGLFESNVAALELWHADGRILDANDVYLKLTGFTRAEMEAGRLRWDELTAPEHRDADKRLRADLIARKKPVIMLEKEYQLRDGRRVPVAVSLSLVAGSRDRGFGFVVDLSQQELARKRSEEGRVLIRTAFSSLNGPVAVLDANGKILDVNEAWVRFAREQDGNMLAVGIGENYLDVCRRATVSDDYNPRSALAGIEAVLAGKRMEFRMEHARGKRWLEMTVQPLRRPEGGAVISYIDITDRHQMEVDARNMRLELWRFARVTMMGELTASLAHELSQPLTAILTNAQAAQRLLQEAEPNLSEVRDILGDIVADDQRAGDTIRRVRSLLKKSIPEYQALDPNLLIVEVVGFIRTEALTKNVAVGMQLAHDLPSVRGDRVQLQQVVLNLVLNALDAMRDTPAAQRRIDIVSSAIDDGTVQVCVEDSGPGIAPAMLDKMFEPFFTAKPEGLGMGLAICRSIVEAHGGRIWARNQARRGAIIRFTLPIAAVR